MSRFTGSQFKGAKRADRIEKRAEAEARNAESGALRRVDCMHIHGEGVGCYGREVIDLTRVSS